MADTVENWFAQKNKYSYLDLMMIMSRNDVTSVKAIHYKLKQAGKWVDIRKFVKKHKHYNPSGLFKLFGSFSDQCVDDVRDCLMGWILDNYRNVITWTRMALQHKKLSFDVWMENMRSSLTHGDDIALYLLCRMYDKHAYVHTSRYGWSTLPLKVNKDLNVVLLKCDLELALLDMWSFGEVIKIRKLTVPAIMTTAGVIPGNAGTRRPDPVVTENVTQAVPCEVPAYNITQIYCIKKSYHKC